MATDYIRLIKSSGIRRGRPLNRSADISKFQSIMSDQKWVAVLSKVLGDIVVICESVDVVLPVIYKDKVRYYLAEAARLTKVAPAQIVLINEIKRTFGGEVIS